MSFQHEAVSGFEEEEIEGRMPVKYLNVVVVEKTLSGLHVSAFEFEQTKYSRNERLTYAWSQLQIHIN